MTPRPDPTFAVCVFTASSEGVAPAYQSLAAEVGTAIAAQGWRLVYGGGQVGLMGVVARAALSAGGSITGIIPRRLNSREVAFDDIDDLVLVETLAERKQLMDARSDAYVILPGGIGTLDELLEVLTTRHLGYHAKPLVMADPDGYWKPFGALLDHMVASGMLRQETADMPVCAPDAASVVACLLAEQRR